MTTAKDYMDSILKTLRTERDFLARTSAGPYSQAAENINSAILEVKALARVLGIELEKESGK